MKPSKTETTAPCECSGEMKIKMIEPLEDEPKMMRHTFECTCGAVAPFKFSRAFGSTRARGASSPSSSITAVGCTNMADAQAWLDGEKDVGGGSGGNAL
jgi:hypothetical protein